MATKLDAKILAMYLGCRVQYETLGITGKLYSVDCDSQTVKVRVSTEVGQVLSCYAHQVKPILRRLEDMTEEETKTAMEFEGTHKGSEKSEFDDMRDVTLGIVYLLSKSFDLFGLIDSGEAINAKTLTT